jgi:hypothetical protein
MDCITNAKESDFEIGSSYYFYYGDLHKSTKLEVSVSATKKVS